MEKRFTHLTPEQIIYKYKNYKSLRQRYRTDKYKLYLTPNEREQLFERLIEAWEGKRDNQNNTL